LSRWATIAPGICALAVAAPALSAVLDPAGPYAYRASTSVRLTSPLQGPLHERFGYDRGRLHAGIDIAVLRTDAVHAALPGVVTAVGYLPHYAGYGQVVKIRHQGGRATMYAHLASARVRVGEYVSGGELIGRAGCTGSCTGPHLHFELRVNGKLVDPLRYLAGGLR
jgi:murein DD-endopeptidase MepM/ murein hydrolase activator NlpD